MNVDRLGKLELYAKDSRMAVLKDGTEIPVSRGGYAKLKELLEDGRRSVAPEPLENDVLANTPRGVWNHGSKWLRSHLNDGASHCFRKQ